MNLCASILPFLFTLPALGSTAHEPELRLLKQDFARGIELTTGNKDAVQTLLLPEVVYMTLSDRNMRDLRVFNGAGEEVPHALRSLMDAKRIDHADVELPLFPLRAEPGGNAQIGDVSLQLKRSPEGRVIELKALAPTQQVDADRTAPVLAYLMDLGSLSRPVTALSLLLPSTQESFLVPYAVEASSDLATWSTLVAQASLASLDRDGARLERTRVSLPATSRPYLRLRWLDQPPPLPLERVRLELASESGVPARRLVERLGKQTESTPPTYTFESLGVLPVNRVQVELPDTNTLIQAALKTRDSEEAPWRTALDARYFRITNGVELSNDPHPIATHVAKFWALFVDPQGGGLGSGMPTLRLEYFPHQLAFVARGEGPFTLAFGKAQAPHSNFDWSTVTQMLTGEQRRALPEQSVTMGESFALAGSSAFVVHKEDRSLQQAALWAVLILGVAMLGGYCWKLFRKLPAPEIHK